MDNENLISLDHICTQYEIEVSFINSLNEYGLVKVITWKEKDCINHEELRTVEQLMNLHYNLGINLEGLDAISNLLQKMDEMNEEINSLKNKLEFYGR